MREGGKEIYKDSKEERKIEIFTRKIEGEIEREKEG